MESADLFKVGDDVLKAAARFYDRTLVTLLEDVRILKKWMKTQPHLPEVLDDKSIENFLFLNKCSIERTKQRIDMYYTLRTLIPDMYENINPKLPYLKEIMDAVYWVPLPKLTKEMYRVMFFKLHNGVVANGIAPKSSISYAISLEEVRLKEDIMFGDVFVFDLDGVSMSYFLKWTPSLAIKTLTLYEKVFSIPLKAVYFVNSPPYVSIALTIMKRLMKPKLFQRVHVCQDTSILNKCIPKDILPKDYDGEERSLAELQALVKAKLTKYQDRFNQLDNLKVNESLRPQKLKNDEILGFHGNFKKLEVD